MKIIFTILLNVQIIAFTIVDKAFEVEEIIPKNRRNLSPPEFKIRANSIPLQWCILRENRLKIVQTSIESRREFVRSTTRDDVRAARF